MGKVASLYGGPTGERIPDEDCVDRMRKLLEMAESGEITAVSFACNVHDGSAYWGSCGGVVTLSMVGAMNVLSQNMGEQLLQGV